MAVVQNLYQIFKLPASFVAGNDCSIKSYTISQGLKEGNIVSIGDNIVFQQIRYANGDERDHRETFEYIQKLRRNERIYKRQGKYKEASILNRRVTDVLFVKEIVNVVVDGPKSDFHRFRVSGFDLNGVHYVYLCSGSGQIRRNTATFVDERLADSLRSTINCGLDKKTSEFVLAKYSAYFALAFSSILWVRTPRVCVAKDFFRTIEAEPVDFITKDASGESVIEPRRMDIELNCADGQGLIDPDFAKLWAKDMDLPYVPCSFVARSAFVKGNLAAFDFRAYAHEHGIETIRDRWGVEYPIDEIDVILSESQFKTCKYYSSWQEYQSYAEAGRIHWGVARYNRREDPECVLANYQYIQALTLSDADVRELIKPTVDWINGVCSGDVLATMLYCFGAGSGGHGYGSLYGRAQSAAMKAVVKNVSFLGDAYVRRRIYKSIAETINRAKLGKVWVRGNYQFMIADPVAQCQAALGLDPVGVVPANHVWCDFWRVRKDPAADATDPPWAGGPGRKVYVDLCRSPMIDQHEHNPSALLLGNDEADRWLSHLYSGCVLSTYDTATARMEDADFDGDIVLTTDNPLFLKGSHKDHSIITYEKGLAKPAKMTVANITKTVSKGFGTGVGGFSNAATCMYALAAVFDRPGQEDRRDEIMGRIKLLREIVGQEIDRIKGADKPSLPSAWRKFVPPAENETPEQAAARYRANSMVVSKKPYFFRYLYPELNRRFKRFEASYNQISRDMFGAKFKKLLRKQDKTEEERNLVRRYQKYSPLISSDCTMNRLCREFENVDFDIRFDRAPDGSKRPPRSMLPDFESRYADSFDQSKLDLVVSMYRDYCSRRQIKYLAAVLQTPSAESGADDCPELRSSVYDALLADLRLRLADSGMPGEEFLFYCHRASLRYRSFNWAFAWDVLDEQIIQFIPQGTSLCPVPDPVSGTEYLGRRYSLADVTQTYDVSIQKLMDAIFGDPYEDPDANLLMESAAAIAKGGGGDPE